ncbi:hypothetical protein EW146_g2667 [Bondarzewia mesenterica]|uniref:Cytochrome P450 n=1 Tax=Bondarzewia mesenterica TaxID=1095465 RepID=A0A4S4M015_9AGAM|nr:hypothetical protein EW146_g2667 [Bondarzewia mesenterica]
MLGAVLYSLRWRRTTKDLPLPPGPPGHWLWGNEVPEKRTFLKYAEWTDKYGPVYTLRHGRRTIIVIGRNDAALEIMEKEGAHTADRPRAVAGGEMISGNMRLLLIGVGDRFRKLRKALHSQLQPKIVPTYEPLQRLNAKVLVHDILDNPEAHCEHAKRFSASVILSLTYGKPSPSHPADPDITLVNLCLLRFGLAVRPGAHIVEDMPWLKYLPFYGLTLRRYHREELNLFTRQLQGARSDMAAGKAAPSFSKYLLERQNELGLSDNETAYLAGSMFGAGSETTASAIGIIIMASACFPEAQKVVQDELDTMVGPDRLPIFGDWDSLPQIHAFILETFRWRPGTAPGFQHRVTKDIIYRGYRIPAGTTVLANHWAIGRDPELFPDADKFDPQRWLDEKGQIRQDLKFPNFGFGRRVCPGQPLAMRSLFITTAFILWSFKISEDPSRPIDTFALSEGSFTFPLPFAAKFEPRQSKLREFIAEDEL